MPGLRRLSRYVRPLAFLLVPTLSALLGGCGGGSASAGGGPLPPPPPATKGKYFTHVVIVVQENRTFDNLFATFPGADGTTIGKTHNGRLRLREADLESPISPHNAYTYWRRDWNRGKMNGFDTVPIGRTAGTYVYEYVHPTQIRPYWDLAKQYVLSDHTFQTQGSGSFTAHQDLIRGGTEVGGSQSLIDFPNGQPWGCAAPHGTRTTLISLSNQYQYLQGPFPCLTYPTLRDLLDASGVSWRYYTPAPGSFSGNLWDAFEAIKAVREGPEWSTDVASPETQIFTDLRHGSLASVSWVIPDYQNSDHPGDNSDTGPSWVSQIVNAIGESPLWNTTAILVVWDDWGGWYDHVAPPGPLHYGGLGFRVPLIAVAPYAKAGYISHNQYELGSIVRFVEDNWGLGSLGTTDRRAADFAGDFFDFAQQPRKFVPIQTPYSRSYLLHRAPSNEPVDYE
jgi:phospholipase C